MSTRTRLALFIALFVFTTRLARAETLQVPVGGKAIPLGEARVACGNPGGGWVIESAGHAIRPPAGEDAIGKQVQLKIASDAASCGASVQSLALISTGRWPTLDPATIVLSPDEGRLEARGRRLRGVGVAWRSGTQSGVDVCQEPKLEANAEQCTWGVGHGVSADPPNSGLSWVPAGGRSGPDVATFDIDGKPAPPATLALTPARVLLATLVPPDSAIDLSAGRGEVPIFHPEAVTAVDCGAIRCEMSAAKLLVRGLANLPSAVDVKFRLAPHVFLQKKDVADPQPVAHLAVLHCPMSVASGPPLRAVDNAKVIVRIEGRCSRDLGALKFQIGSAVADVLETEAEQDAADVVLRLGNVDVPALSITAVRADDPGVTVAIARVDTQAPPQVKATLGLQNYPNLNFIPNNRGAVVHVPKLSGHARLAVLPIEGVYEVSHEGDLTLIQGDLNAAGSTALRFGYRMDSLPGGLSQVDLGVLVDPLQRSIHEANLPAPIGPDSLGPNPLIELVCADKGDRVVRIMPGQTEHLPFEIRDTCRLVFHRERLSTEYGTQKINLDIEVVNVDGSSRPEGHVSQTVVLRSGPEPKLAWIHGVKSPFDRVIVKVSQAADEAHYIGGIEIPTGAPDVKWVVVLGTGHARLYATTAIPTGLYRFGDAEHSGLLSLNFGIVSRLTWLDSEGHEGFLGLEAGIMAIGLTDDKSSTGQSLTQIGAVGGLGISVPIANRSSATEAAINLHAWVEEDISHTSGTPSSSRFAVIFGPSISIGNVGTNL